MANKELTEDNHFGLTLKQQLFCETYIELLNQTRAYMKIYGLSYEKSRTPAYKLMKKEDIQAYITFLKAKRAKEMNIDKNYVLKEALNTYQKCSQAKPVTKWNYEEKCLEKTGEYQFDSKGAVASLELITKLCGFNEPQKLDIQGTIDSRTIIKDDI